MPRTGAALRSCCTYSVDVRAKRPLRTANLGLPTTSLPRQQGPRKLRHQAANTTLRWTSFGISLLTLDQPKMSSKPVNAGWDRLIKQHMQSTLRVMYHGADTGRAMNPSALHRRTGLDFARFGSREMGWWSGPGTYSERGRCRKRMRRLCAIATHSMSPS